MELAFNVNAGPLSQVAIPIMSLSSAVQLAVGAHGWWRARERSKSLSFTLECAGASLVPANSFNRPVYLNARQGCTVRGVSIMNGEVIGGELPTASTSREGSPGHLCLRALTTGLLCFYSTSAVVKILAELIPYSMLHYEQEGETLQFEGPVIASLIEYVKAVELEEDSTGMKKQMLKRLDTETSILGSDMQLVRTDQGIRGSDHAKVRALLKWMLTSMTKRSDTTVYPTRSLFAWSIAMVMSQLGFQISASRTIISSSNQYVEYLRQSRTCYISDTVLVVDTALLTDPMEADIRSWDSPQSPDSVVRFIKPRIVPICAIPWIMFRQTSHLLSFDIQHLSDVWNYTFDTVRSALVFDVHISDYGIRAFSIAGADDHKVTSSAYASMLSIWSQDLNKILQKPMSRFVKLEPQTHEAIKALELHAKTQRAGKVFEAPSAQIINLWHLLNTIVLASLYAILTKVLIEDGSPATGRTEVCFHTHTLQSTVVFSWADKMRDLFSSSGTYDVSKLRRSIAGMVSGAWVDHDKYVTPGSPSHSKINDKDVLGLQRNGIFVVCGGLVRPHYNFYNFAILHYISTGQILNLPTRSNGYIVSTKDMSMYCEDIDPSDRGRVDILQSTRSSSQSSSTIRIRIDAEPDWEDDPTSVVLAIRTNGQQIRSLSPIEVEDYTWRNRIEEVFCTCDKFTRESSVCAGEEWYNIDLLERLTTGERLRGRNYFCNIGPDTNCPLLAIGSKIQVGYMVSIYLAIDCIQCAYDRYRSSPRPIERRRKYATTAILSALGD